MTPGLPGRLSSRIVPVGGLSRFPVAEPLAPRSPGPGRVTMLSGSGGGQPAAPAIDAARKQSRGWEWSVLGPGQRWTDDVAAVLAASDVVVTQAGENALAEVAACRKPAVVIPADRPHDEQHTTARVLGAGPWPVVVEPEFPASGWGERLAAARRLDGAAWASWCDGKAATRIADVLDSVAAGGGR